MSETLYADHPEVYDVLYAEKDYDAEVAFVLDRFEDATGTELPSDDESHRALVIGCGTGEHAKRLREAGLEVVGVDKYPAMVERARAKSDAEFRVGALPGLPVEGSFDLVWLPFTVIQHLRSDQLADGLAAAAARLAEDGESSGARRASSDGSDGGLLVFDQIATAEEAPGPRLHTYPSESGTYARLVELHEVGSSEYRWDSLVFTPDGEFFADTHLLTDYDPRYLSGVCDALGLSVEVSGWYDASAAPGEDGRYTFVAR